MKMMWQNERHGKKSYKKDLLGYKDMVVSRPNFSVGLKVKRLCLIMTKDCWASCVKTKVW
jgi:hypothetical protein